MNDDDTTDIRPHDRVDEGTRFRLSQETIAIATVGVALAALLLFVRDDISDIRTEARTDRAAWQAESRQLRSEAQADREAVQEAARADREAARADREAAQEAARADREAARADREAAQEAARAAQEAARADREAARADREAFQQEIIRLTAGQARLAAIVDSAD